MCVVEIFFSLDIDTSNDFAIYLLSLIIKIASFQEFEKHDIYRIRQQFTVETDHFFSSLL